MASTLVQSRSGFENHGSATTATGLPSATTAGNLLLMGIDSGGTISATPTGFTLLATDVNVAGAYLYGRIALGSDTIPSFVMNGAYNTSWFTAEFSGVNLSGGLAALQLAHGVSASWGLSGGAATWGANSVTPTAGDYLIVSVGAGNSTSTGDTISAPTVITNSFNLGPWNGQSGQSGSGPGIDPTTIAMFYRDWTGLNGSTAVDHNAQFNTSGSWASQAATWSTIVAVPLAAAGSKSLVVSQMQTMLNQLLAR